MSDELNDDDVDINGRVDDPAIAEIEALLAELDVDDLEPVTPPAGVWAGIDRLVTDPAVAPVVTIAPRRRSFAGWALAAAAAVVLVVAATVAVVGRGGTKDDVLSAAVLTFDPAAFDPRGAGASAEAHLVDRDGIYSIRLTDTSFPALADDDLELWLIEPDSDGKPLDVAPVSLVDPDGDGVYEVPAGLDPSTHYVVDISIEPRDGDTAHSGQSILRGALQPS